MSDAPRPSIRSQADHLVKLTNVADRLETEAIKRGLKTAKEAPLWARLSNACVGTMRWLVTHEVQIKRYLAHAEELDALLAMEPHVRAAILAHGPTVAALAVQMAERERVAAAGGPTR